MSSKVLKYHIEARYPNIWNRENNVPALGHSYSGYVRICYWLMKDSRDGTLFFMISHGYHYNDVLKI